MLNLSTRLFTRCTISVLRWTTQRNLRQFNSFGPIFGALERILQNCPNWGDIGPFGLCLDGVGPTHTSLCDRRPLDTKSDDLDRLAQSPTCCFTSSSFCKRFETNQPATYPNAHVLPHPNPLASCQTMAPPSPLPANGPAHSSHIPSPRAPSPHPAPRSSAPHRATPHPRPHKAGMLAHRTKTDMQPGTTTTTAYASPSCPQRGQGCKQQPSPTRCESYRNEPIGW